MQRYIKQFRYYGESSSFNTDLDKANKLDKASLSNGGFLNNYTPVVKLGIQTIPGVKFYLNGSEEAIIIGNSGLFELDLEDRIQITGLRFSPRSIDLINSVEGSGRLIIDIVYEVTEE